MQISLLSLSLDYSYLLAFLEQLHGFVPSSGLLATLLDILDLVTTGIVLLLLSRRLSHRHPMNLIGSLICRTRTSYAAAQTRLIRGFLYTNLLYRPYSTLLLGTFDLEYLQDFVVVKL